MRLDKRNARRRLQKKKGNSYEEEIDISIVGAVRRQTQKHLGNRFVRAFRDQRAGGNLAIRARTTDAVLSSWDIDRTPR